MKAHRHHLLAAGTVAILATLGLSACNGGDGGGMGMATNSPQPAQPQPQQPAPVERSTASFAGWVQGQFADGVRTSDTATPANVGSMKFKFDHKNDPHAFDALFSSTPGNGS